MRVLILLMNADHLMMLQSAHKINLIVASMEVALKPNNFAL
jgi:hypothetical protein